MEEYQTNPIQTNPIQTSKKWWESKTIKAGIATICGGIVLLCTGKEIEGIISIVTGIGLIFDRTSTTDIIK